MKTDDFYIGDDTVNFDTFWKGRTSGLSKLRSKMPYKNGIIPQDLTLYTSSNPAIEKNELRGSAAARRIATYFKETT